MVGVSRLRDRLISRPLLGLLVAVLVLFGVVLAGMRPLAGSGARMQIQTISSPVCGSWYNFPNPNLGVKLDRVMFNDVAAIADNDVWILGVGSDGGQYDIPLFVHWDGAMFRTVPAPPLQANSVDITRLAALASDDVWAVGKYTGNLAGQINQTLFVHWDGKTWSIVPGPDLPEPVVSDKGQYNSLDQVTAIAKDDIWAVGKHRVNGIDRTLTEHWDGKQWKVVPSPNYKNIHSSLFDVSAASSNDVWALGRYEADREPISGALLLHWNGSEWSSVDTQNINNGIYWGLHAIASNDAWVVGSNGDRTRIARWNGETWNTVNSPSHLPTFENTLTQVIAVSAQDVWAVGHRWDADSTDGPEKILLLHWDGKDWREVSGPEVSRGQNLKGVSAMPNGDLWAVGYSVENEDSAGKPMVTHFIRCSNADK